MRRIFLLYFPLFICASLVYAQERVVSGRITDGTGESLPGVNVIIKDTNSGVISNLNGAYSLSVPNNNAVLVYTFMSFEKHKEEVGNRIVINVSMRASVKMLDQVVVTSFGIERQKKSLGYATSTVNSKELTIADNSSTINALQGKVAGLRIQSSNGVGGSQGIVLRGYTSISGSNHPLFVIDGAPLSNVSFVDTGLDNNHDEGSFVNGLNPSDIESITVLKGASATALYGSRAANGVIVIDTKKGDHKNKTPLITYKLGMGFTTILRSPELQNTFGQGWNGLHYLDENGSWGPRFDGRVRKWGRIYDGKQKIKPFVAQPSSLRDFYEMGYYIHNNASFSGGIKNARGSHTTYYLSFGHSQEKGNLPYGKDRYTKYNIGFRGSYEFAYWGKRRIKFFTSIAYDPQKIGSAWGGESLKSTANNLLQIPRDFSIVDYKNLDDPFNGISYYYTPYSVTNPYLVLKHSDISSDIDQFRFSASVDIDLYRELKFKYEVTYNNTVHNEVTKAPKLEPLEDTPNAGSSVHLEGEFSHDVSTHVEINHDLFLTYTHKLGHKFGIDVLLGLSINQRESNEIGIFALSQKLTTYHALSNAGDPLSFSNSFSKRRLIGLFSSVTLEYSDLLYLTLTGRNDWSSTLPLKNNTFFYPSATVSFVVSEILPSNWKQTLTHAKLRAGYGFTGNDADPYLVESSYVRARALNSLHNITFPLGGQNAFKHSNRLGAKDLKPEISSELEAGLELSFFDHRFGVDLSYYLKNTINQIQSVPVAPSTGYSFETRNIGNIENKGWELSAFAYPLRIGDFSWKISGVFSSNRSKVIALDKGLDKIVLKESSGVELVLLPGRELPLLEIKGAKKNDKGQIVVDGNGIPIEASEATLKSAQINFDWGGSMEFNFRGWSLEVTAEGRVGGYMFTRTAKTGFFTGNTKQSTYNDRKPFVVPNSVQQAFELDENGEPIQDEEGTNKVRYVENTTPVDKEHLDNFYQKGGKEKYLDNLVPKDFIKIREVALSYAFPEKIIHRLPFSSVHLSVVGRNLALFTPPENNLVDPESSTFGADLTGQVGEFSASVLSFSSWGFTLSLGF